MFSSNTDCKKGDDAKENGNVQKMCLLGLNMCTVCERRETFHILYFAIKM